MNQPRKSLFIVAGMLAVSAVPAFAAKAKIGGKAPEFTLTDVNGESHALSVFAGKTVVREKVNPECPFVVKHCRSFNMPKLQSAAATEDTIWLSINSGAPGAQGDCEPDEVKNWMKTTGASPAAYLRDQDGMVGRLYGARTTPHMFVINPDGDFVFNGAIDSIPSANTRDLDRARNYAKAALAAVAAGDELAKSTSRRYGCSVKY